MLESKRSMKKKWKFLTRGILIAVPVILLVVLLSQTVFARSTYLISDGDKVILHSSYATDPAAVLDEAGLTLGENDYYTTQEGPGVAQITIQRRQTIAITVDGKTRQVDSYGEKVSELLKRLGIPLGEADRVSVDLDVQTSDGMEIAITRASVIEESYITNVPFETVYCYDPTLPSGKQVELTKGVSGQLQRTDKVFYIDGEEVGRIHLTEVEVRRCVDAVVAIGTAGQSDGTAMFLCAP